MATGSTSNVAVAKSDMGRSEVAMTSIKWLRHAFQILENGSFSEDDVLSAQAASDASPTGSKNKGLKARRFHYLVKGFQLKGLPV